MTLDEMKNEKSIIDVVCFELKKDYPNAKPGDLFFLPGENFDHIENSRGVTFPIKDITEEWFKVRFTKDRRLDE